MNILSTITLKLNLKTFIIDHGKSAVDGLHSWVLQRIRQGNQRDEAQTLTDVITFLEDEEARKVNGSIQRFFAISQILDEPRIGLTNAASIQNQLIRMVSYHPTSNNLILTSLCCVCSDCLNGDFEKCQNHKHEIVFGKIATDANAILKKSDSKCRDEYIQETSEFFQYVNEWDKQWIEFEGDVDLESEGDGENGQAQDGAVQDGQVQDGPVQDGQVQDGPVQDGPVQDGPAKDGPAQDGPAEDDPAGDGPAKDNPVQNGADENEKLHKIVDSPPELIQDDQEYWSRKIDFHYHLALLFSIFKQTEQMNEYLNSLETYDKLNLDQLREVWDCINEDRSFDGDFDIGYIDKILIKRHYLQECGAHEWFNIEMINVAFKNIQFRSKNKVIALKAEVMHEVEV